MKKLTKGPNDVIHVIWAAFFHPCLEPPTTAAVASIGHRHSVVSSAAAVASVGHHHSVVSSGLEVGWSGRCVVLWPSSRSYLVTITYIKLKTLVSTFKPRRKKLKNLTKGPNMIHVIWAGFFHPCLEPPTTAAVASVGHHCSVVSSGLEVGWSGWCVVLWPSSQSYLVIRT